MTTQPTTKAWYRSWTIWANVLALALVVANGIGFADFRPDPWVVEVGTVITLVINILLRYFRTSQPIER